MQHIVITIDDQMIEQTMFQIAQHEGINLQELVIQAIRAFIKQKSLTIKKLDPLQHSTQIHYAVSEDLTEVKPFASVKNSATFGKELRESIWGRTANG